MACACQLQGEGPLGHISPGLKQKSPLQVILEQQMSTTFLHKAVPAQGGRIEGGGKKL